MDACLGHQLYGILLAPKIGSNAEAMLRGVTDDMQIEAEKVADAVPRGRP